MREFKGRPVKGMQSAPHRAKALFAGALLSGLVFLTGGAAAAQTADPVKDAVTSIVERFVTRANACGAKLPYTPGVVVDSHPTLISFYFEDKSVHASRWSEMPPEIQGMLSMWAAKGKLGLDAKGQFGEVFNSLLVPHELGHFASDFNGRSKGQSFWDGEVYANRVAIAFWRAEIGDKALAARLDNYNRFLDELPNPVPAGKEPRAWFEANYEALGNDAQAYGWYQGLFMREARALSKTDEFCTIIAPASPEA